MTLTACAPLLLHLGVLFTFSSVVAVESGSSGTSAVGREGSPRWCYNHAIASASVWTGCWVGPPWKYLYLFPRCYFSGPHGFMKSFGGYFGSFWRPFAWLPVGANGHWVIFYTTCEECGAKPRNLRYGQRHLLLSSICPYTWPGFIHKCSTCRN